ncbi:MAG: aspartate aminotransferase [Deltaproteobacteria bacterium RIFCSPLOWO2_02_FULL_44_10]|nr:MAG: aspartate aminotransferase [Deltaproteobacteria bacterium RIFCSPHIGHO2_02_FULL_44_16]OGQ45458.1 MAG: aspartate aminotransferase [Deltaproteobacteria bacterium RIFCSPLOWO2_02_FULL_44_10]
MKPFTPYLSDRVRQLAPSATLAMAARAKALAAQGHHIISFSVGEPDFDTPSHIKEAAKKALDEGKTKYTAVSGIPELKRAIITTLKQNHQLDYTPEEIIVTCGAKHALYNAFMTTLNPGDEVIIPAPYWVSYTEQIQLCGAHSRIVMTEEKNRFLLTASQLKKAITSKTRMLVLNSPCNPTGSVYHQEELQPLVDLILENNLMLVSDEIYEHLVYGHEKHVSPLSLHPAMKERSILIHGVSKTYAMTGWRMGYAAGPKSIIEKMDDLQSQQTTNITSFVQVGCVEALVGSQESVKKMRDIFEHRRNVMLAHLKQIPEITCFSPEGAFYLFPNVTAYLQQKNSNGNIDSAHDLAEYLLTEAHVAVMPGEAFGTPGYLRFSYATSEENIEEGMQRIKNALEKLKT